MTTTTTMMMMMIMIMTMMMLMMMRMMMLMMTTAMMIMMMMMLMMMMSLSTPLARTPLPFPRFINPSVNESLHFGFAVRMPMIKICKPFSPISVAEFLLCIGIGIA